MLTCRENLLCVLHGEEPAWVPYALNLWQWYGHHQRCGTLPPELRETRDQVDALRVPGCDIFSRNCGGGVRVETEGVTCERTEEPGTQGPRHVTTIRTPHGILRGIVEDQIAAATSYAVEDTVKAWSRDGKACLWLLEPERYRWTPRPSPRSMPALATTGSCWSRSAGRRLSRMGPPVPGRA